MALVKVILSVVGLALIIKCLLFDESSYHITKLIIADKIGCILLSLVFVVLLLQFIEWFKIQKSLIKSIILGSVLIAILAFSVNVVYQYQRPILSKEEVILIGMEYKDNLEKNSSRTYVIDGVSYGFSFWSTFKGQRVYIVTISNTDRSFADTTWLTINAYTGEIIRGVGTG
jgi:hypothetical protein